MIGRFFNRWSSLPKWVRTTILIWLGVIPLIAVAVATAAAGAIYWVIIGLVLGSAFGLMVFEGVDNNLEFICFLLLLVAVIVGPIVAWPYSGRADYSLIVLVKVGTLSSETLGVLMTYKFLDWLLNRQEDTKSRRQQRNGPRRERGQRARLREQKKQQRIARQRHQNS